MDPEQRQEAAVKILILIEPQDAHYDKCPAKKDPAKCTCHLLQNAKVRAKVLDDAGMLSMPLIEED